MNKKKVEKRIKIVDIRKKSKNIVKGKEKINESNAKNGDSTAIKNGDKKKKVLSTPKIKENSIEDGKKMFEWVISPMKVDDFMKNYWEKKPKLIKRSESKDYYSNLLSTTEFNSMLKDNYVEYTKNVDITSYKDGVRETLNPEGRVTTPSIWNFYSDGCSIRMLNPQTFIPSVYKMNSKLQEYFHCMVGTNVYLTPPNSQGFAPHYDDIEAFVLQLEGQKHWRVYKPRSNDETLPRTSSLNFEQGEIGKPVLDVVLEAGDMLYFPRGYIHQAVTDDDAKHSLHITMSTYQKNTFGDLMETLVPATLQRAIDSDVSFRAGLPLNIHQLMGMVHSQDESPQRNEMRKKIKALFFKLFDSALIDEAVDQMGKKYQVDALPPYLSKEEKQRTVHGETVIINEGSIEVPFEIKMETKMKLVKANILRLVDEGDSLKVYFHSDNSKEYHQYEPTFFEIEENDTPVITMLVNEYPNYIAVEDLPLDDEERKLLIVTDLWERGLLMCDKNVS